MNISYTQSSQILIGLYLAISGIEWIYLICHKAISTFFDITAILLKLQDQGFLPIVPKFILNKESHSSSKPAVFLSGFLVILGIALIGTAIIEVNLPKWGIPVAALIVHLVFIALLGLGLEGADQMASIVLFSLAVTYIMPSLEHVIGLFITAQLILSYSIAGIAKLFSKQWRSGEAIIMILSIRTTGTGNIELFRKNPYIAQFLCISVIAFEIAWITLPLGGWITIIILSIGVLFHLINAQIMGLNLFLWSFIAAYPWALHIII